MLNRERNRIVAEVFLAMEENNGKDGGKKTTKKKRQDKKKPLLADLRFCDLFGCRTSSIFSLHSLSLGKMKNGLKKTMAMVMNFALQIFYEPCPWKGLRIETSVACETEKAQAER